MKDLLIVVPYRNREDHLKEFLENTPAFFDKTGLTYDILICELDQKGDWNAGLSCNSLINFVESKDSYRWLYIHHVDIWPTEGTWTFPDKKEIFYNIGDYGSCLMLFETFFEINGYCNDFWGWGGEDNELYDKLRRRGYRLVDHSSKNLVTYNTKFQNHPRKFNGKNYANAIKQTMIVPEEQRSNILHFSEHGSTKDLQKVQEHVYKHIVCPKKKSPSETTNKNLIISYLRNIDDFNEVVAFVKSAQLHSSYQYDIVTIIVDQKPDSWMVNQLTAFGVECVFYEPRFNNSHLDRYHCYQQFLTNDSRYEFILHLDINDTIIQTNPFEYLNLSKLTFVKKNNDIIVGAFAGPKYLFLKICELVLTESQMRNIESKYVDRTILNDCLLNQIDSNNIEYKTAQDLFCVNLSFESNPKIYYRRTLNSNNKMYAIVHQYDFISSLKDSVDKHFQKYFSVL